MLTITACNFQTVTTVKQIKFQYQHFRFQHKFKFQLFANCNFHNNSQRQHEHEGGDVGGVRVLGAGDDDRRPDILPQALLRGQEGHIIEGSSGSFSPHTRVFRTVSLRSSFRVSVSVLNYKFPSFEYSSTLIKFFYLKFFIY